MRSEDYCTFPVSYICPREGKYLGVYIHTGYCRKFKDNKGRSIKIIRILKFYIVAYPRCTR